MVDNGSFCAAESMDRVERLMDSAGTNGVNTSQVLNNLGGFMAVTSDIGGGGERRARE